MFVALRAFHLFPFTPPCLSPSCVERVLGEPLLSRIPVLDDAGTEYAFDLAPTQGTLLFLVAFVLLNWAKEELLRERD